MRQPTVPSEYLGTHILRDGAQILGDRAQVTPASDLEGASFRVKSAFPEISYLRRNLKEMNSGKSFDPTLDFFLCFDGKGASQL